MQQRMSCKSETDSALRARQRCLSCFLRRSYSSWIRFLCSLSLLFHGHFITRHCSGPHEEEALRIFARCSLIHVSSRCCMPSIIVYYFIRTQSQRFVFKEEEEKRRRVIVIVMGNISVCRYFNTSICRGFNLFFLFLFFFLIFSFSIRFQLNFSKYAFLEETSPNDCGWNLNSVFS